MHFQLPEKHLFRLRERRAPVARPVLSAMLISSKQVVPRPASSIVEKSDSRRLVYITIVIIMKANHTRSSPSLKITVFLMAGRTIAPWIYIRKKVPADYVLKTYKVKNDG